MAAIPRGVQTVQWKNADKSKSMRYRVRIQRKDFAADRLFETLEEATDFLAATKSAAGRSKLNEDSARSMALQQAMDEALRSPKFSHFIERYKKDELDTENELNETKKRNKEASKYRLNALAKLEVPSMTPDAQNALTGLLAFPNLRARLNKQPLGDFTLKELTPEIVSAALRARCEQVKAATAQRDLNILRAIFNRIEHWDPAAWARIGGENPFTKADRTPLRRRAEIDSETARDEEDGRLDKEAEERLFKQLARRTNPEMLQIVALALTTGMRRSEILFLDWERVDTLNKRLRLRRTKNNKGRWVPLTPEAITVLKSVPKLPDDPRLFHYTADGFASNWQRVKDDAKLGRFRFHDCRREFISKLIEQLSSPVAAARAVGLEDMRHFQAAHVERTEERHALANGIQSEQDLRRAVGHANAQMTARYFARKTSKK